MSEELFKKINMDHILVQTPRKTDLIGLGMGLSIKIVFWSTAGYSSMQPRWRTSLSQLFSKCPCTSSSSITGELIEIWTPKRTLRSTEAETLTVRSRKLGLTNLDNSNACQSFRTTALDHLSIYKKPPFSQIQPFRIHNVPHGFEPESR